MTLLGAVMESARTRSGRRWRVEAFSATVDEYQLRPLGSDVRAAQDGGRTQGGVRTISVPYKRLRDEKAWRVVVPAGQPESEGGS